MRLCFIGNMLGETAGYIPTQGLIMARLFSEAGFDVTSASPKINKAARLADIAAFLIKGRKRFDIVVLDVYSGQNLIMAETVGRLCRLFKLPLIMVLRGGNLPHFAAKRPRMMRRILERADSLIAPSAFLAGSIKIPGLEIRVIPNILDLEKYPFRERSAISPNLFWMRSFHPIYNPQMAVRVLAELKKSLPGATLTMAGVDKGLEDETKAAAGLTPSVRFAGFLDAAKKRVEFARADIFINTNRVDNMPVAVVEACAMGLPVVATDAGGLPFLLSHGETGLLVPNEDVKAMAEAVKSLLNDPSLTRKLSRNGRKLAERSAWKNVRFEWENLFAEVLNKKETVAGIGFLKRNSTVEN
jgi:glycosyltransferase involved in cell wall biosynthesis